MVFKIGNYVINIDAMRIDDEAENISIKGVRFSEHDTMAFMNHINAYICTYTANDMRKNEFNQIFNQLATYGYFGDDLKEIYSQK